MSLLLSLSASFLENFHSCCCLLKILRFLLLDIIRWIKDRGSLIDFSLLSKYAQHTHPSWRHLYIQFLIPLTYKLAPHYLSVRVWLCESLTNIYSAAIAFDRLGQIFRHSFTTLFHISFPHHSSFNRSRVRISHWVFLYFWDPISVLLRV
jgi:hypothetical protein